MKKQSNHIMIISFLVLCLIALSAPILAQQAPNLPHYSSEEYKELSMDEAKAYWDQLEADLEKWKEMAADYAQQVEPIQAEISQLKAQIQEIEPELVTYELICLDKEITRMENMSYDQLISNESKITEFEGRLRDIKGYNGAEKPENQEKIAELEGRLADLREGLKLPTTWTVKKDECLYIISGYDQIYSDPLKWPRIYRANRDKIKNPSLIYPGWVLKIPRGVVNSWTVYKGESLWKIAGYDEVYDANREWAKIYEANRDQIKDPDLIYPKQVLTIPR